MQQQLISTVLLVGDMATTALLTFIVAPQPHVHREDLGEMVRKLSFLPRS